MNQSKLKLTDSFLEHHLNIHKYLRRYLHKEQDIEDIIQEVYIKAVHAAERKNHEISQPKAFLFTIAKNLALNELTKKANRITRFIDELSEETVTNSSASVESEYEKNEKFCIYARAVSELPEKCRQVYLLRKVYAFSHKEIAAQVGISVSCVEKYLSDGIKSCKQYVKRYEQQDHLMHTKPNKPFLDINPLILSVNES